MANLYFLLFCVSRPIILLFNVDIVIKLIRLCYFIKLFILLKHSHSFFSFYLLTQIDGHDRAVNIRDLAIGQWKINHQR